MLVPRDTVDWRNNSVLLVYNHHSKPIEVRFSAGIGEQGLRMIDIMGGRQSRR